MVILILAFIVLLCICGAAVMTPLLKVTNTAIPESTISDIAAINAVTVKLGFVLLTALLGCI